MPKQCLLFLDYFLMRKWPIPGVHSSKPKITQTYHPDLTGKFLFTLLSNLSTDEVGLPCDGQCLCPLYALPVQKKTMLALMIGLLTQIKHNLNLLNSFTPRLKCQQAILISWWRPGQYMGLNTVKNHPSSITTKRYARKKSSTQGWIFQLRPPPPTICSKRFSCSRWEIPPSGWNFLSNFSMKYTCKR